MDINNLQPSVGTIYFGRNGHSNELSCGYTNAISSIGVSDSYFLGYVSPDMLPSTAFTTKAYKEGNDPQTEEYVFEPVSKNNAAFGYDRLTNVQFSDAFKDTINGSSYNNGLGNARYWNNLYPEFGSMALGMRLQFFVAVYNPSPDSSYVSSSNTVTYDVNSYTNINRVLDGYIDISISVASHTFTFKFTDLVDGTIFVESGDGFQARIFLNSFGFYGSSIYNGNNSESNYGSFGFNIKTFGDFEDGTSGSRYTLGNTFGSTNYLVMLYTSDYHIDLNGYGRNSGVYNKVSIARSELPTSTNVVIYRDGIIVRWEGNYNTAFYTYITNPQSAKSVLGLCFRTNPGRVWSYIENSSFATSVTSSQFLGDLKTGDINNPAFKSGLEPWQYVDFDSEVPVSEQGAITNDFTDEDVPPYEPTPPTPTGDEGHNPDNPVLSLATTEDNPVDLIEEDESRDTPVNFPISAFMTQYVLSAQDIWDMGAALWSGIGDPNSHMIENIARVYGSSGTFNIANIMDLFVSVKAFPFNLNDQSCIATAPAMTVGTGAVPLLNHQMTIFTASTYMLDCGTVATDLGAYQLGSSYDYRNYVNCEISCFLPYCGTVELNPSDVFPYTLHCKYFIDMISGSCTACVYALRGGQEILVGSKNGQIGKIVPITASNVMGIVGTALSDVASAVQTIGQAAISFATRKALGSTQMPIDEGAKNVDYLKEVAAYKNKQQGIMDNAKNQSDNVDILTGAANGIGNIMTRGGVGAPSLSPGTGLEALMISKRPYITIRRLKYASPNTYGHTTGFYSTDGTSGKTISSYSGFTQFENVDLTGIYATKEELDEIKMLLENGVYL